MSGMAPSERLKFLAVGGKRVLHVDFSNVQDEAVMLQIIAEAGRQISAEPLGSLYTLTDVTNTRMSEKVVEAFKLLTRSNKPYVKAGAVVGLRPVQRVLYTMVMSVTGRELAAFASLDEARGWLSGLR